MAKLVGVGSKKDKTLNELIKELEEKNILIDSLKKQIKKQNKKDEKGEE